MNLRSEKTLPAEPNSQPMATSRAMLMRSQKL